MAAPVRARKPENPSNPRRSGTSDHLVHGGPLTFVGDSSPLDHKLDAEPVGAEYSAVGVDQGKR